MWKPIKEYESYLINEYGDIMSLKNNKQHILKKKLDRNTGYYKIILSEKGKVKTYNIHRLVAETFINNPLNYKYINHKDENKLNNAVSNLEWCTNKYNSNYGSRNDKLSKSHCKKIIQYDLSTGKKTEWNSIKEINEKLKTRIEWSLKHHTIKNNSYWSYKEVNNEILT